MGTGPSRAPRPGAKRNEAPEARLLGEVLEGAERAAAVGVPEQQRDQDGVVMQRAVGAGPGGVELAEEPLEELDVLDADDLVGGPGDRRPGGVVGQRRLFGVRGRHGAK